MTSVPFEIKISDFGFAKLQLSSSPEDKLERAQTICGTPAYMAPDQILERNKHYTEKFDVWSLGNICYELLVGHPPFIGKMSSDDFELRLKEGNYEFPSELNLSPEIMHLISRCLQY